MIVGFSNNSFILNDPASFPFVECSDEELVNISGFSHRESRSEIEARTREVLPDIPKSELDEELKLGPRRRYFQCFSVCPQNMRLPLLRDDYKLRKEEKQRKRRPSGLFDRIDEYVVSQSTFSVDERDGKPDAPSMHGEYYLAVWDSQVRRHVQQHQEPSNDIETHTIHDYLSQHQHHDFWIHRIVLRDYSGALVETLWFWGATDLRPDTQQRTSEKIYPFDPMVFARGKDGWKQISG